MRKILSLLMMMVFSVFMFAATKTTVYYTAPAATIGTYTVKLNTNQQTNPDSWFTYTMTKTDLSYNGDPVYTASFTDLWDGVAVMQIQLYDGSTWKSQKQPFSSWAAASTYNGKMFVHATDKWVDPPTSGGGDTPEPTFPVMQIAGIWTEWKAKDFTVAKDSLTATYTATLAIGEYEFKVLKDNKWLTKDSDSGPYALHRGWPGVSGVKDDAPVNLKLIADAAGTYTFTWTYANDSIGITFPDAPVVIPAKFYVTGDSALVTDAGFPGKAWNPDAIKSEKDTFELNLHANQDYKLKLTLDGTWTDGKVKGYDELTVKSEGLSGDADNNITFKLAEAGKVTVVYISTKDTTIFKVEGNFYVPTPHYYIAGTMNEWNVGANELVAGNGDTLSLAIALEADSLYEFKVVKVVENDTTWYGMQETAAMVYGNSTGWWLYKSEGENNQANVGLQTTKAGEYEFIFEANEHNMISVVIPEPEKKYFAKYAELGKEEWIWHAMTEKDGLWLTDTIVYLGGGMNIHESMEGDGKYYEEIEGVSANDTAYFTFNPSDSTLAATLVGKYVAPEPTFPVMEIAGAWDVKEEVWVRHELIVANDSLTATYTVSLEAGSYEFKMIKDNKWLTKANNGEAYGLHREWTGVSGVTDEATENLKLTADVAGTYTFTWTYANDSVGITFPEKSEPVLTDGFYLVGNFNDWKPAEGYMFEKTMGEGEEYMFNTTLTAGDEFKAVKVENGQYNDESWFPKDGDNYVVDATHAGEKTIYFRPVYSDEWGGHFYVAPNEVPQPGQELPVVGLGANFNGWNWGENLFVPAADSLSASIKVTITELAVDSVKIVSDGNWLTKYGNNEQFRIHREWPRAEQVNVVNEGDNMLFIPDVTGEYIFTWTYADSTLVVTFPEKGDTPEQPVADGYYLVGNFNDWKPAEGYLFEQNPGDAAEYMFTTTLVEGNEFKAVYVENGQYNDDSWFPKEGGNYVVDTAHAGEKTIYFRPVYNDEWGGHFYIAPNGGTGIEETIAAGKAAKVLRNGHFFILKGDKIYNVTGAVIR